MKPAKIDVARGPRRSRKYLKQATARAARRIDRRQIADADPYAVPTRPERVTWGWWS